MMELDTLSHSGNSTVHVEQGCNIPELSQLVLH
jgi:hypothetical protein